MQTSNPVVTRPGLRERRRNLAMRRRFEAAQELLQPLLGKPENHTGATFYKAICKLQDTYPELSGHELEALVAAVVRSMQNREAGR